MIFLSKFMALASIIYLIKIFLYPFYRPVSSKHKKRTRAHQKIVQKEAQKEKFRRIRRKAAIKCSAYIISETEKKRLQKDLERLNREELPEEIRIEQFLYAGIAIVISFIVFQINTLLGYVSCIFILLGWLYPTDEIQQAIQTKNKNIAKDFPGFYSMVYYQYAKSVNIYLADVIRDYLPNANKYMAEELGYMIDNIEYGEEYALKQFKRRVPIHYIIKFCDIMETRLKGYDNTSQMAYLKEEIDRFRVTELEKELEKRQESNSRIQLILIVILGIYIFIYYIFMILDAMELFQ